MSDSVLLEIAKQIPFAVILFGVIVVFLKYLERQTDKNLAHEKEMEAMRIAAAKERNADQREFDAETRNLWAVNFKNIVDRQEQMFQMLGERMKETANIYAAALDDHDRKSEERYEKMGITQDLLQAAKENMRRKER